MNPFAWMAKVLDGLSIGWTWRFGKDHERRGEDDFITHIIAKLFRN